MRRSACTPRRCRASAATWHPPLRRPERPPVPHPPPTAAGRTSRPALGLPERSPHLAVPSAKGRARSVPRRSPAPSPTPWQKPTRPVRCYPARGGSFQPKRAHRNAWAPVRGSQVPAQGLIRISRPIGRRSINHGLTGRRPGLARLVEHGVGAIVEAGAVDRLLARFHGPTSRQYDRHGQRLTRLEHLHMPMGRCPHASPRQRIVAT